MDSENLFTKKVRWKQKNHLIRLLLLVLINLSFSVAVFAQVAVKGKVTDAAGLALPGAPIKIKGTTTGTTTDANGNFTITVPKMGVTLQILYMGFISKEVVVNNANLVVVLQEEQSSLKEVVVVGYGTMKKRDVTGAITSVSAEDIEKRMPSNVFQALQGAAPGVQITSGSGQPGESSSIQIRGTSTFSSDGASPLYIVDGAPLDNIDAINPRDIESIEILKDAASAAIYGSRSANGVIIISTKQGKEGKPSIDVKYDSSWGNLAHYMPQANSAERKLYDLKRREFFLENRPANANESIQILNDSLNVYFNVDNDYQKLAFQTGKKDQVDLSLGGGNANLKYFVNTGYYKETGIIPNTGFDRFTTRINSDYRPSKRLNMGTRLSLTYSKKKGVDEGGFLNSILTRRPYFSLYHPDGDIVGIFNGQKSPVALPKYMLDFTDGYRGNFFQFVEVELAKKLKFRTNLNAGYSLNKRNTLTPSIIYDEWQKNNSGSSNNYLNWNLMSENYFSYSNTFNKKHNVSAMLGGSLQKWRFEQESLYGINSSTDAIYTMNAFVSNLDLSKTGTWRSGHALASVFTRVTYDYKSRYLFNAVYRRDGSSRFAKNNKWGGFPSVSAGWRFSDEEFMSKIRPIMDDAKLRVSYGITGNEQIGNYDHLLSYATSTIYDGVGGVAPARLGIDNLAWEQTSQFNVGLDLSLLKGRVKLVADYYDKYTNDLLADFQIPKEWGYSSVVRNIGEVRNRGIELGLSSDIINKKDFKWNASVNFARNNNTIEKLSEGKPYLQGTLWWMQEGGKIGDFYGYKAIDIFQYDQSNAFTNDGAQLTPVFENNVFTNTYLLNGQAYTGPVNQKKLPDGRPFRGGDVNWQEGPDSQDWTIDDKDRMILGNAQPKYTGGVNSQFTYKNWSLFVSVYFATGLDIYNYAAQDRNAFRFSGNTPAPEVIHNIWVKQGDIAKYPRPYNDDFDNARLGQGNSMYIEDGSYLRLRNVRLNYNLPKTLAQTIKAKNLNLYAYVNNALTFTNYTGYDPEFSNYSVLEIGRDNNRYPRKREFGLGINVNF